jgi:hypothetical protein
MLKLIIATFVIAVHCSTLLGGYSDRPALKEDSIVQRLVSYTAEHLAATQNLILDHLKITRVQTQVVAGINYKIDFTGETMYRGLMECQAVIFVRPDLSTTITEVECDNA